MKLDDARCVYVMYNPKTKLTKIGVSENVESRKNQIEQACGCNIELIYNSPHLLFAERHETVVHEAFKQHRCLGEWFDTTDHPKIINTINESIKDATEDPLIESYKRGWSISRIAKEYEVTRQAILARLKKYGVYDKNGCIYEKLPSTNPVTPQPVPARQKENTSQHIDTIDDSYDDTTFLDGEKPDLPLNKLKRIEANINFNGEWYQVSIFKDGEFFYSYTRDINKARAYVQGVRALSFSNTIK